MLTAIEEYKSVKELGSTFYRDRAADLTEAKESLEKLIASIRKR